MTDEERASQCGLTWLVGEFAAVRADERRAIVAYIRRHHEGGRDRAPGWGLLACVADWIERGEHDEVKG